MREDTPRAQAIKQALRDFEDEQVKVFQQVPLHVKRIGINRQTWKRLDRAAREWLREIRPAVWDMGEGVFVIAGMVKYATVGKHRVVAFRNYIGGMMEPNWLELQIDEHMTDGCHLPDGMVELIYDVPPFGARTAGHMVDITPLLAAADENQ